uniref:Reticulon domain-containing protein n=1 Tax=Palpitomonas bilix TaxID=652834 RepID=A0A7S3GB53_9EUKA|mmetsp:Transcript_43089/g.111663  ORF Transcript_43089/g.111663 Transcript_43089/m.111663 type:complete len:239 (+) Transcript_43089:252-968(+)
MSQLYPSVGDIGETSGVKYEEGAEDGRREAPVVEIESEVDRSVGKVTEFVMDVLHFRRERVTYPFLIIVTVIFYLCFWRGYSFFSLLFFAFALNIVGAIALKKITRGGDGVVSYDDKEEFLTRAEAEEFGHLLVVFSNFAVRILKKTLSFVDPTFSVKMMLASLFAAILFQILPASLIFYAAVIVPFYAVRSSDSLREYIRAADKVVDSSLHTFASSVAKQAEDLSGRISKAGKGKKD